ncbi:hypothetical protein [Lacticaseibacillus kribbianus]|uniref:hypothetical protein n=1 Tax=Lacticaseibacillus kribbianus TaxID=2926292 RepID=UPI001CD4A954|nr:hypothetical protein [Lacticaseibacillus kribbianus]
MSNRVHPEELRALAVLQQIEPVKFAGAFNADRPDIQTPGGRVGCEVTRAVEQSVSALLARDRHAARRYGPHRAMRLVRSTGGPRDAVFPNAQAASGNDLVAAYERKRRLLPGYDRFTEQDLFLFMLPEAEDIARLRRFLQADPARQAFAVVYLYDARHCWRLTVADNAITRFAPILEGKSWL